MSLLSFPDEARSQITFNVSFDMLGISQISPGISKDLNGLFILSCKPSCMTTSLSRSVLVELLVLVGARVKGDTLDEEMVLFPLWYFLERPSAFSSFVSSA